MTPFYKAFLVTADVPEIYMQEFWATTTVHHHSIRFKMDNRKCIVNLEYFRKMMHICPRLIGQIFDELPFEEEILAFLRFLGHSREIRKLTDVNINKLHQPWRSFAAVINKFLSEKSIGYDSLRLSQAQILWGMYHKKNVDFAYLLWEDFVYQVEHKDAKKSNEMYYLRFTKVIIHYFMTKDPSIPRRNKFGVMLPIELTNEDIRNSEAYKEYYAVALGAAPPKTKASVRNTKSSSDTTITPLTAAGTRLSTLYRDVNINLEGRDVQMTDVHTTQEFEDTHVTLTLVNPDGQQQCSSVSSQFVTSMLNPSHDAGIDSLFETTLRVDVQASTTVTPLTLTASTLPPSTIPTISQVAVQIQSDRLRDEAQAENKEFLKNLDENIQKIIKEQVNEQVKVQVSKILPQIEKTMNEQLEAEVLTRSSKSSKTFYAVAADLSEMELKKILIEKMESNKDVMMMRIKMKNPSLDQTGGPRNEKKEKSPSQQTLQRRKRPRPLASLLKGPNLIKRLQASVADDQPIAEASQHLEWFQQQKKPPTPDRAWNKTPSATHRSIQPWISDLAKQADSCSSFNELMDRPVGFSTFLMNRLKVDTLTPELLAGPTYELMKGS
nr:hypothetical protein [Tanacetum cinerariifolium]